MATLIAWIAVGLALFAVAAAGRARQRVDDVDRSNYRLQRELEVLRRRIAALDQRPLWEPEPPPPPAAEAAPPASPLAPFPPRLDLARAPAAHRARVRPAEAPAAVGRDLESFVGGRVFLVAGIVAVLFGLGFFLRYLVQIGLLGPASRVALGALAGGIAIGVGDFLRGRGYALYGRALTGGGFAALYVCAHFATITYGWLERPIGFALAAAVTGAAVAFAVRRSAPELAHLGLFGGYLAPALFAPGGDHLSGLAIWLLLVDLGALVAAWRRGFRGLEIQALVAGCVYFSNWHRQWFGPDRLLQAGSVLALLVAMHLAVALLPDLLRRSRLHPRGLAVAALAGAYGAGLGHVLAYPEQRFWLGACVAALAATYGAAAFAAERLQRGAAAVHVLRLLALGSAALAVPLVTSGMAIAPAFVSLAVALVAVGARYRRDLYVGAGFCFLALAAVNLAMWHLPAHRDAFLPFLNSTFVVFAAVPFGLAAAGAVLQRAGNASLGRLALFVATLTALPLCSAEAFRHVQLAERGFGWFTPRDAMVAAALVAGCVGVHAAAAWRRQPEPWRGAALIPAFAALFLAMLAALRARVPGFAAFQSLEFASVAATAGALVAAGALAGRRSLRVASGAAVAALLVAVTAELYAFGECGRLLEGTRRAARFLAQVEISATWAASAAALLAAGFALRSETLRWSAIALFALSLGKVFLFDLATVEPVYRIGSFLAVGVLLVAASFLYHRRSRGRAAGVMA